MRRAEYKRSKYEPGMIYAVPLGDGSFCFAQALRVVGNLVNVVDIVVSSKRMESIPGAIPMLTVEDVIAIGATWLKHLNRGDWCALGVAPFVVDPAGTPNQKLARKGGVGVKHSDLGLWTDLLRAWNGIDPWNVMFDPEYFDKKLAPGVTRPNTAIVLTVEERERYRASRHGS